MALPVPRAARGAVHQAASGTLVVTPTATGAQTYTLVCSGGIYSASTTQSATLTVNAPSAFSMSSLVSDGAVTAATTDANLKNPWGIVFGPTTPVWIANNATGTSTLYDGTGTKLPLTVSLPAGLNGSADATGIVFNGSATDFVVTQPGVPLQASPVSSLMARAGRSWAGRLRPMPRTRSSGTTMAPAAQSTRGSRSRTMARRTTCTRPTSTTARSTSSTPPSPRSL